jgi:S1-C subfamily serine protease
MSRIARRFITLAAVASFSIIGIAAAGEPDLQTAYQQVAKDRAESLVTITFVLKMKMGGMGDQESEEETSGVMIDPTGLVLVSNNQLSGFIGLMRRFSSGGGISAIPTDIKVLVGDDTEGLEAELIARDTELDLAWVRIKEPGDRKFAAVDLGESVKPSLGQTLLSVGRLGKFFDRVPAVEELRISAFTSKPRDLYIPSGGGSLGLPVYTLDGKLVGVAVMQMPDSEDSGGSPFSMMGSMNSGGGVILPAPAVVKATQRAKETAAARDADEEPAVPAETGDSE